MADNFVIDNENEIEKFLSAYDKFISEQVLDKTEYDILNCNDILDEIDNAIDVFKNDNAVGGDMIPTEFLKHFLTRGRMVSVHLITKLVYARPE